MGLWWFRETGAETPEALFPFDKFAYPHYPGDKKQRPVLYKVKQAGPNDALIWRMCNLPG
jgi:hypothetical protein